MTAKCIKKVIKSIFRWFNNFVENRDEWVVSSALRYLDSEKKWADFHLEASQGLRP